MDLPEIERKILRELVATRAYALRDQLGVIDATRKTIGDLCESYKEYRQEDKQRMKAEIDHLNIIFIKLCY